MKGRNSKIEELDYVVVIDNALLNPKEKSRYLGLEGRVRGACELIVNGMPRFFYVKFPDYKHPIKLYPECLKKIKKKKK